MINIDSQTCPNFCVRIRQVFGYQITLTKIYIETLFKVQFIQDSTLFKVLVLTGFIVLGNSIIVKALIQLSIGLRTFSHQFLKLS